MSFLGIIFLFYVKNLLDNVLEKNNNKYMKQILLIITATLFTLLGLVFAFKGSLVNGKLDYQKTYSTHVGSPFELSNSTARFALTQAIVENKTFFLNEAQARFAAPDVVDTKGKFLSIFTPGVSLMAVPFYMIGQKFGVTQIATYGLNIIFSLFSVYCVYLLSVKIGSNKFFAAISGLVFIFATNALPYSQTLTQHLISSVILLLMIFFTTKPEKLLNLVLIGLLFSLGFVVDFPNALMGLPILLYVFFKQFSIKTEDKIYIKWKFLSLVMFISMIPFLLLFGYYNFQTTGSYFTLAQSIGRSKLFDAGQPVHKLSEIPELGIESKTKGFSLKSLLPFDSRKQLNGFYILVLSDERSWIHYSPILFLGVIGLFMASRTKGNKVVAVLGISIMAIDVALYSSFGDPWGGWAFGPRYLIPSAAISAVGIGYILTTKKDSLIVWFSFMILLVYSVAINSLGVFTTNAIPPKIEAVNLPDPIPYTETYNINLFKSGMNTSLVYQKYFMGKITSQLYFLGFNIFVISGILIYAFFGMVDKEKNDKHQ